MNKARRDLTEGSIARNIWILSLPMIAANLLQNMFNIVDMIFVGRLGPAAIAAVGMSGILLNMLFTMIFGISMGTVALVSRFIGAKNVAEAEKIAMQSVILGLFCYVIIAIIGYPLAPPLLKFLGAKEAVVAHGVTYIRIMFLGSFTMILSVILNSILRAAGDAMTPLKLLAFSTVLNIALDPLLIFGIGIFPRLGVAGSALATTIARGAGVAVLVWIFLRGKVVIHLKIRNLRVDFSTMLRILRIGIFASFQGVLRNLSAIVLAKLVAVHGTFAVAAYVVSMRLQFMVMMPGFGLATAVSTLVGQNLGAGKPKRAERSAWVSVAFGIAFMTFFGILYALLPGSFISIFNTHPEVIRIGTRYLRVVAGTLGFVGLSIILGRALNGAGDTFSPMVITSIGLLGFRIALSIVLAWKFGLIGIWLGIASSNVVQGIMMTFWFNTGRWKLKNV